MKRNENLMTVALEECAEIQQELCKALRFGVNNHRPEESNITNSERIQKEFHQLRAVIDMMIIQRVIHPISESEQHKIYRDKVESVEKWEKHSMNIGILERGKEDNA